MRPQALPEPPGGLSRPRQGKDPDVPLPRTEGRKDPDGGVQGEGMTNLELLGTIVPIAIIVLMIYPGYLFRIWGGRE